MPVDHTDVVASVKAELSSRGINLQGPCGAFQITMRVAWALREEGAGLIAKFGAQNGCEWPAGSGNKYGVDIVMYPDGTLFDILINSETQNNPAWQVPTGGARVDRALYRPAINPDPGPDPNLHRYDGGGNDTDICDRCGKSRFDPVHDIPESKVRHHYDGGEQDTGKCDICGRGPDDPLHRRDAVCDLKYRKDEIGTCVVCGNPKSEHATIDEGGPARHKFAGTGTFCSECGKPKDDAIHNVGEPTPIGDLSETNRLLGEILESTRRQERTLGSLIDLMRARDG